MKILFDHQIYVNQKFGGISRYFNEIAAIKNSDLQIEKLDPALASLNFGLRTDLLSRGVRFLQRKVGVNSNQAADQSKSRIKNKILETEFDIFHPTYFDPYFLDYVKKPFVLTVYDMVHEIYHEYFRIDDETSRQKKLLCEKASAIIAISENTKKDLVEIFSIPESKIKAIQLASDFDQVYPFVPPNSGHLKKFILFVGNRWGYKNFYFTATALADLLKGDPELKLLCTGHPFSKDEMGFFKDLGIQEKVSHIYLNDDRELSWAYRNASLFIFPSLYEGFGLPILEAFASECPVISSRGGSLAEVGGDGVLYFNPKNFIEIREAARQVLYDTSLRNNLIQKGKARFKKFSWDKCRAETIDLYKSISA